MAQLREVTRWVTGVSRLSHGTVSFLILSELNKEGRAKGRSLDHRCDFAISMVSSEEDGQDHVKLIRTTKSWHGPTGKLGQFVLWHQLGRLSRSGGGA
jgi:predicted ATP-dependent serine protease